MEDQDELHAETKNLQEDSDSSVEENQLPSTS